MLDTSSNRREDEGIIIDGLHFEDDLYIVISEDGYNISDEHSNNTKVLA